MPHGNALWKHISVTWSKSRKGLHYMRVFSTLILYCVPIRHPGLKKPSKKTIREVFCFFPNVSSSISKDWWQENQINLQFHKAKLNTFSVSRDSRCKPLSGYSPTKMNLFHWCQKCSQSLRYCMPISILIKYGAIKLFLKIIELFLKIRGGGLGASSWQICPKTCLIL